MRAVPPARAGSKRQGFFRDRRVRGPLQITFGRGQTMLRFLITTVVARDYLSAARLFFRRFTCVLLVFWTTPCPADRGRPVLLVGPRHDRGPRTASRSPQSGACGSAVDRRCFPTGLELLRGSRSWRWSMASSAGPSSGRRSAPSSSQRRLRTRIYSDTFAADRADRRTRIRMVRQNQSLRESIQDFFRR